MILHECGKSKKKNTTIRKLGRFGYNFSQIIVANTIRFTDYINELGKS